MFDHISDQSLKISGTPTKKRKLNQPSPFDDQIGLGVSLTRKKSLIDHFHFIGAINRKDSYKLPLLRKKSSSIAPQNIAHFNEAQDRNQIKLNLLSMDIQNPRSDPSLSSSEQNQCPRQVKLVKRVTMVNVTNMQMVPKLFRCNSGIDIESINIADERKYGDNIYLQQISGIQRRNTANSKQNNSKLANKSTLNFKNNYNRKTYQQDSDQDEQKIQQRLLKDYQISSNLQTYAKNHQSYLCLNKLQRIFYYVKKINFTQEYSENQVFQLCSLQIRLYNKDDEGHLLRFYQSWQEQDSFYLVFQTASTSIQEKLQSRIKLRENQVWSLLTDCCAALTWMKRSNQYHLNLKPGNILKCREKYKLSDPFVNISYLSKALKNVKKDQFSQHKLKLAFSYAAPELLEFGTFIQGLEYDKCDIYSLGICILQNITGFSVNLIKRDLKIIKKNNEKYLRGYSPALRNLLIKMVNTDPAKRPTSQQIGSLRSLQLFDLRLKTQNNDEKGSPKKMKRKLSL